MVHAGVIHATLTGVSLFFVGRFVERLVGHAGMAVAYAVSGLGASLASVLVHPHAVSAGCSGAVFGLLGVILGWFARMRTSIPAEVLRPLRRNVVGITAANLAVGFEEPEKEDRVGQITQVDIRADVTDKSVLAQDHEGYHTLLAEISKELMHLQGQMPVFRHCLQICVEAVDHDNPCPIHFNRIANGRGELARRQFSRVNLTDAKTAFIDMRLQIHVECCRSHHQCGETFIEEEECGSLAALRRMVVPSAATAAVRAFSVAVTLGSSRKTSAPRRRLARNS